ncbi:unnamed protein product [Choristocarpus tenellus]
MNRLTSEQRRIVLTNLKPGEVLSVVAFAGTGKTTCLRAYAMARPHLKVLYLAFNVSVRDEAAATFPPNVSCKGVHQLAFAKTGWRFSSKMTEELREGVVADFLKIPLSVAQLVIQTLSNFFASAAPDIDPEHVAQPRSTSLEDSNDDSNSHQGQEEYSSDEDPEIVDIREEALAGSTTCLGASTNADTGGKNVRNKAVQNSGRHLNVDFPTGAVGEGGVDVVEGGWGTGASAGAEVGAPIVGKTSKNPPKVEEIMVWARLCWVAMRAPPARNGSESGGFGNRGRGEKEGGGGIIGSEGCIRTGQGQGNLSEGMERAWGDGLPMTHSGYLKLYQLSQPVLGGTKGSFDVVMLDEAQDSNPCIASIVLRQTKCARLLAGDTHQSIYGFMGAEDHLRTVKDCKIRHLTQVFRFGPSIAHVANTLVGAFKAERRPLLGLPERPGWVSQL